MTVAALPKIVRFLGTDDHGPGGSTTCPHCGATGRYVIRFQVEDGRTLGAMRGCIKLFPVTELAREHEYFVAKRARYAKQRPPWKLSSGDADALQRIEDAIDGRGDARQAILNAQSARRAAAARYRR
ncbi:MAG TPA: hypothetical protein VFZ21_25995 [Gemmatimonadaceae bacterium]|nr:hypothetical protein [Gemmatimonadaceae bacterium]